MRFSEYINKQPEEAQQAFVVKAPFLRELQESSQDVDGAEYFEPSAVHRAYNQNRMSRETVIHLSPKQFLALANALREPNPRKEQTIAQALENGSKLSDLPYLSTITDADGNLQIDGHEGRHRMMALMDLGVRTVPVILISGEGGDGPSYRWGSTDQRPQTLTGQDDRATITMPKTETY